MRMSFFTQGQQRGLQGIHTSPSRLLPNIDVLNISQDTDIQLQKLLAEFTSLFNTPKELPSGRT